MYMSINELKRVKGAINHISDVFCKIIRHETKDAMSRILKNEFKLTKILKQLNIDPGNIYIYHLVCFSCQFVFILL